MSVGVILDTHGLLRPEAVRALRGSAYSIHAGDVGDAAILDPASADRSAHCDQGQHRPASHLHTVASDGSCRGCGVRLYVIHDVHDLDPRCRDHCRHQRPSHKPSITRKNGVLYFNPGERGDAGFRCRSRLDCLNHSFGNRADASRDRLDQADRGRFSFVSFVSFSWRGRIRREISERDRKYGITKLLITLRSGWKTQVLPNVWCREGDSNPHNRFRSADFKSAASASSAIPASLLTLGSV